MSFVPLFCSYPEMLKKSQEPGLKWLRCGLYAACAADLMTLNCLCCAAANSRLAWLSLSSLVRNRSPLRLVTELVSLMFERHLLQRRRAERGAAQPEAGQVHQRRRARSLPRHWSAARSSFALVWFNTVLACSNAQVVCALRTTCW